jgi:hypothetical protein
MKKSKLESTLLSPSVRLGQCLEGMSRRIFPRESGDHVALLHQALEKIRVGVSEGKLSTLAVASISSSEVTARTFGATTSECIRKYKHDRSVLAVGQTVADAIVGELTVSKLDDELLVLDGLRAVKKVRFAGDIVIMFQGVGGDAPTHTLMKHADAVIPEKLLDDYKKKNEGRLPLRLGFESNTTNADVMVHLVALVAVVKAHRATLGAGAVCIFGSSSGGRTSLLLAQEFEKVSIAVDYVGLIDAAFFDSDVTNRPDPKAIPLNVPNMGAAPGVNAKAAKKRNFFQLKGNDFKTQLRHPFSPKIWWSTMKHGEVHGSVPGYDSIDLGASISAATTDANDLHGACIKAGKPRVKGEIAALLNALE